MIAFPSTDEKAIPIHACTPCATTPLFHERFAPRSSQNKIVMSNVSAVAAMSPWAVMMGSSTNCCRRVVSGESMAWARRHSKEP